MANESIVYDIVTSKIIDQLEKGTVPWKRPWNTDLPMNLVSKKEYNGINLFLLMIMDFKSPYFVTYKQANDLGGQVKKGEKGIPVIYWNIIEDKKNLDSKGKPKTLAFLKYYTVFNVTQIDNLKTPKIVEKPKIAVAEEVYKGYINKPELIFNGSTAFYSPVKDQVNMPSFELFNKAEDYYATLFHELIHSTGHEKRLNRFEPKESRAFGSESYSKEELIAELGSAFLCAKTQTNNDLKQSSAYIKNWLEALRNDKKLLIQASGKAQRAVNHILGK